MENSKNVIIIILVIIIALLLGFLSFFIYDKMHTETNNSIVAENANNKQTENLYNKNNDKVIAKDENNNNEINDSQISNNLETTSSSSTSDSATGKLSSKQSPLNIGEWGISSRYVSGNYVDVPATVTNITRGSSAAEEVKQYLSSGASIYKYENAKEGMEWAVIEYSIDLTQVEKETTAKLDTSISGTGDNILIKYNGAAYAVSTINMTSNKYTKGSIEKCKFAVQLPIGCSEYLIVLGSSSSSQAFFNGK